MEELDSLAKLSQHMDNITQQFTDLKIAQERFGLSPSLERS